MSSNPDIFGHNNFTEWFEIPGNICLVDDNDFALFTLEYPGFYWGHYCFESRGKEAKQKGLFFLREMFTKHGAKLIGGLTPIENKPARWMTRQLGFKSYGFQETPVGVCELFIKEKNNE